MCVCVCVCVCVCMYICIYVYMYIDRVNPFPPFPGAVRDAWRRLHGHDGHDVL